MTPRRRAVVVGGGILGTWHAVELRRHGITVQHLEADAGPTGASVRNFGLVWVSGRRSGEELDVARRARQRWEEIAADVPDLGFRPNGSLTVALSAAERQVMEAYAATPEAAERGTAFLEPAQATALNPAVGGHVTGALHCERDAAVEPRRALAALRSYLAETAPDPTAYEFHPSTRVVELDDHAVVDSTGRRWEADVVVIATGAAHGQLRGTTHLNDKVRRVRLQMFETERHPVRLTTSLADGDSLRYYPAYEVVSLDALGEQNQTAATHHLQLLLVQRHDGGLTIGDTHAYDEPFDFDLNERPTQELLDRARRILGTDVPPIARRWEGIYSQCVDGAVCLREQLTDGVWLVTGPGGSGMTCSPAIAADTLIAAGLTA